MYVQRGTKVTSLVARGSCAQHLHDTRVTWHTSYANFAGNICVTYAPDARRIRVTSANPTCRAMSAQQGMLLLNPSVWGLSANKGEIIIQIFGSDSTASRSWKESFLTISVDEHLTHVQRHKFCRQFHLEKAWISTGPVTAENEERSGSALYVEDGNWSDRTNCYTLVYR
jgi:hypothetical protein